MTTRLEINAVSLQLPQAVNPENVYLVVQPGNIRNVTAYVIFACFKQTDADKQEHEYVKFTIHSFKQIQHVV